jgi:hypothetical protein
MGSENCFTSTVPAGKRHSPSALKAMVGTAEGPPADGEREGTLIQRCFFAPSDHSGVLIW